MLFSSSNMKIYERIVWKLMGPLNLAKVRHAFLILKYENLWKDSLETDGVLLKINVKWEVLSWNPIRRKMGKLSTVPIGTK
jgi:hypothetical protein